GTAASYPGLVYQVLPAPPGLPAPQPVCSPIERSVAFYDVDHVKNETWSVTWEGQIPSTPRSLGRINLDGTLVDPGAAICVHGVLAGDVALLDGCTQDTDCDFGQHCVRDPNAPSDVVNGLCLDLTDNQTINGQPNQSVTNFCSPILRSDRRFRITSAKQNVPL